MIYDETTGKLTPRGRIINALRRLGGSAKLSTVQNNTNWTVFVHDTPLRDVVHGMEQDGLVSTAMRPTGTRPAMVVTLAPELMQD